MSKVIFAIVIFIATGAAAQSAKVVQLAPEDAKEAKALHDEQEALTARMNSLHERIQKRYLAAKEGESYGGVVVGFNGSGIRVKSGWFDGFEYSEDFRFIVPVVPHAYQPFNSGCGNFILGPTTGTVAGTRQ